MNAFASSKNIHVHFTITVHFFGMKKTLILCCVLLCFCHASNVAQTAPVVTSTPLAFAQTVSNEAFGLGEELYYTVGYQSITAGIGSFKIAPKPIERGGTQCFDINFEALSLKSLEWAYKLRNTYRSVVDVQTLLPQFYEQHNREGGYKRDYWAEFDHRTAKARTAEGDAAIEPLVRDVVSAFYYVRTLNLKEKKRGDVVMLKHFTDGKCQDLVVRVLGRQTIRVEAGTFQCVVIEPLVADAGLFKNDGKILLWLSDDERKIPVKVSSRILIGSIDVQLASYKGLRGPLAAKVEGK
jgi:hypothetical protein